MKTNSIILNLIEKIKCSNYQNTQDLIDSYNAILHSKPPLLDLYIEHSPHYNHLLDLVSKGFKVDGVFTKEELSQIQLVLNTQSIELKDFIASIYNPLVYPNSADYLMSLPIKEKYDWFWDLHKKENQYDGLFYGVKLNPLDKWLDFSATEQNDTIDGINNTYSFVFEDIAKCKGYLQKVEAFYVYLFSHNYLDIENYKDLKLAFSDKSISNFPIKLTMHCLNKELHLVDGLKSYISGLEVSIEAQVEKKKLEHQVKKLPSSSAAIAKTLHSIYRV